MKLLVLVHNHFNDMELVSVLSVLKRSEKVEEIAYFNPHYDKANGQHGIVDLNLVTKINVSDYDAVFVPGGAGAKELREDSDSLWNSKRV
nr:DJ-1/PfpI family protein [Mycoplasmopsis bovis]